MSDEPIFETMIIVIKGEMPKSCRECHLNDGVEISDEGEGKPTMFCVDCYITGMQYDWEDGYESKPNWCPLRRILCSLCRGMGWIMTIDEASVDGLGSMDCPDCDGRRVRTDNRVTVEFEKGE